MDADRKGSFWIGIVTHFLGWHSQTPVTLDDIIYAGPFHALPEAIQGSGLAA